jgi:hypothetical protein
MYLGKKLNSFDLNGDGIFSGIEQTLEQKEVFNAAINDLGRKFSPIIGGIFSIIYLILLITFTTIIDIVNNILSKHKIKKFKNN